MNKGLNQDSIQKMNRTLLLNLLQELGTCTRVNLAHITGLKQATITNIVNDFIKWDLIEETGFLCGNKGRRSIGIELNTKKYRVLGIRMTREYFSIAIFNLTGHMVERQKISMKKGVSPSTNLNTMLETIGIFIKKFEDYEILVAGVAIPGPFMVREGRIALMTEMISGWEKIYIDKELEAFLHIPVFLVHDADAGALCQLWHSHETKSGEPIIYVAVGQGVGAGIIIDRKIYNGYLGTAGEIGHMSIEQNGIKCGCGNSGCLEQYCSAIAFTKAVNKRKNLTKPLLFEEIAEMTKNGDEVCLEEYKNACFNLGFGLVGIINILNPSAIILGDDMAHICPDMMLSVIKETVKERTIPEIYKNLTIQISQNQNDSMLSGAGIIAINEIFNNPEKFFSEVQ